MRLFPAPVAAVLVASTAMAADPPPQPPPPTDAGSQVTVPLGAVNRPPLVQPGHGAIGVWRTSAPGHAFPTRRWRDEMADPLGARDGKPLAGYQGGSLYLRDRFDNIRFYPGAAMHVDSLNYFGPGVSDTELKSTVQIRRLRLSFGGEFLNTFQFMIQPEFGPSAFDNPTGTNESSAAAVGKNPDRSSGTYSAVQGASVKASVADAFLNYSPNPLLNIQVGQFLAPFTMDNRTSSNTTTFLEGALASRAFGSPNAREVGAMAWGALRRNLFYYSAGVFLGEGANRPNADNRADVIGRLYTRPLYRSAGPLQEVQIGVSAKYGMRDKDRVGYDYPGMTTQGGYAFWKSTYNDSQIDPNSSNTKGRLTHVIPSGAQWGIAGELRIPYERFDLRGEFVYIRNNTREAIDGYQLTNTERLGTLKGYSYYVQLGYWLWGKAYLTGAPGESRPPRLDLRKSEPGVLAQGVEIAVKWEQLHANYEGAARDGSKDAKNIDGDIKVNAFTVGGTYWASRHVRFSVNYVYYQFPDSSPTGGPDQRALAPGNRLKLGVDDSTRDSAHSLHELCARVGFQF